MSICFILVKPGVPGNVGASARAIKTMGFSRLRLVNPCDYLSTEGRMLAHASGEILENAEVFPGLDEAISDLDLSIATTSRTRDARVDYPSISDLPGMIRAKGKTVENTGIVFGCEESGLSNDEIRMCDMVSTIPLKQAYPSLNLSQAVMIYAYTLADLTGAADIKVMEKADEISSLKATELTSSKSAKATKLTGSNSYQLEFRTMMNKSKKMLGKLEVDRNPALYNRIMERLGMLNEDDIHLILSVLGRLAK